MSDATLWGLGSVAPVLRMLPTDAPLSMEADEGWSKTQEEKTRTRKNETYMNMQEIREKEGKRKSNRIRGI